MLKQCIALPLFLLCCIYTPALRAQNAGGQGGEIIYHVFQRSFYDSNGDLHGDFNGLRMKLDYLQKLGVTAILTIPIFESVYYHNYFITGYDKLDARYGTMQDFVALVKEVHRRGMKLYLDMETQYVTEDQVWWKDAFSNPASKYSSYILWDDSANKKPSSIVFGVHSLTGYNGVTRQITTANLYNKNVQEYNYTLFKKFVDPNNDGKFDDGVDGFRLDHMMDDLDFKGRLTNLFDKFWRPLLIKLKTVNPRLTIIAEQANWGSFGFDYFEKGHVDLVFGFRLQQAIASFNKIQLEAMADTTLGMLPPGKQQIVFLENHDMKRFASAVNKNIGKEKVAAALNLLLGGVPSIYYGQELGMFGSGGFGRFGNTDGNDIPMREAFEWYKADTGKGMALWYKNTGGWWDSTNLHPNDGVSLEEEENAPQSLFNFYRSVIKIRQANEELYSGKYQGVSNSSDSVFCFKRFTGKHTTIVAVNLGSTSAETTINYTAGSITGIKQVLSTDKAVLTQNGQQLHVILAPYAINVWRIKNAGY
ncbi:MAG TPA: alpha-amylase family glycosyl hydrolase [Chitinophagaceae bacterium]|nr:alpha-amylase family glycosyl hydrolase [Chitinophagaceae bacterium]